MANRAPTPRLGSGPADLPSRPKALTRPCGDDALGGWPLHGLGGVSFLSQLAGITLGIAIAAGGYAVNGLIKLTVGLRLDAEQEFNGADLSIHNISATPERETSF